MEGVKEWSDMTWQEKREQRFSKWLDTSDLKISPRAEKRYKAKLTRIIKAIKMEIPDKVPLHIPAGSIVAYNAGLTLKEVLDDYVKIVPAWKKFLGDYDIDSADNPGIMSARVNEILDIKTQKWPGHGLPDDASLHNFVEDEYMKADEYDHFLKDQFDFGLRRFLPRTYGVFAPFAGVPSFASYQGLPMRLMAMCEDPAFRKFFKAIWEASQENAGHMKVNLECARIALEMGFPPSAGGVALAPFDTVADMLRGTRGSVMDMYRQPEKLLETLEVITRQSLDAALTLANISKSPQIFIPMHKGDDSFMGIKQFEKFYWPSYRKLLLGLIEEGCVPSPVVDGSYNTRLEYLTDLPRTGVVWTFEKTDVFKAKKILGNTACIGGNVTAAQLYTQTPSMIKDYCRRLIEVCGEGGGYILSLGSSVDKCDPANLHAIVEARDEYGVY
jgi:hypothetical protein